MASEVKRGKEMELGEIVLALNNVLTLGKAENLTREGGDNFNRVVCSVMYAI